MIKSFFSNIKIEGIACAVPSNKENLVDRYSSVFGEEAISKFSKMTGVLSRHLAHKEQTASDLAFVSTCNLLKAKNINVQNIGALLFVTQTPDYRLPSTACVLHKRLGLPKDCVAFDVNLGCSGYVYGLQLLASLMANSNIKHGLLLAADTINKCIAPSDRSSRMLFGDAGSSTLLSKKSKENVMKMSFKTDGQGFKAIIIPAGACRNLDDSNENTLWDDGNERSNYDLFMNGTDVFNFTISEVPKLINEFMLETQTTPASYDCFPMHQANVFILKQVAKRCKIPMDKLPISMDRYGNTSVASIPITLADTYGTEHGKIIKTLMCGFGVGLSWGAVSAEINTDVILPIVESDDFYTEGAMVHD